MIHQVLGGIDDGTEGHYPCTDILMKGDGTFDHYVLASGKHVYVKQDDVDRLFEAGIIH